MTTKKSIILYDGVCKLCSNTVQFVMKHDKKKKFKLVALQSPEGQNILKQAGIQFEIDSVILIENNKIFLESDAVIEICRNLSPPWNWLRFGSIIPKNIWNKGYRIIARKRYLWFGKYNDLCACRNT